MVSDVAGRPEMPEAVREWFRELRRRGNGGWAGWTFEERSVVMKLTAKQRWETRRLKYGPTGRRHQPYDVWKSQHPEHKFNGNVIKDSES